MRKRLPSEFGGDRIFCSPDALLSMWKPGWQCAQSRMLFAWANSLVSRGDCVWDIGANQGLFALAAASRAGRCGEVVAFEPDLFLAGLIERSIQNRASIAAHMRVLPVAISSTHEVGEFCIAQKDRALNHLASVRGNPRTMGTRASVAVVVCTVSWLLEHLKAPDLVKVDVEGAEAQVLTSARSMLQKSRPRLVIEVAAENSQAVARELRSAEYRMLDAGRIGVERIGPALVKPAWNTLAVPVEKWEAVCGQLERYADTRGHSG